MSGSCTLSDMNIKMKIITPTMYSVVRLLESQLETIESSYVVPPSPVINFGDVQFTAYNASGR